MGREELIFSFLTFNFLYFFFHVDRMKKREADEGNKSWRFSQASQYNFISIYYLSTFARNRVLQTASLHTVPQ